MGVLALYPECQGLPTWSLEVPVWIWFAGGDQITPPSRCRPMFDEAPRRPTEHVYPGVEHAFDMRGLPTELEPGQAAIAYDRVAADDLWANIETVLRMIRGGQW
jgi:dienelactone hydrolase